MKAVGYDKAGPIDAPDALVDFDAPDPEMGPRDLLVEVKAVSVNPVDWKVRTLFEPTAETRSGPARILGWDAAGVVQAVGADVDGFAVGDRVFYAGDLTRPGSNAERQAVDHRIVGKAPASLSFAEAAALPLTTITAWEALFDRLRLESSGAGPLLIVGAGGGVGSIAIQLARALTDATVIATASRPETQAWVSELGAHQVLDHAQAWGPQLSAMAPDGVSAVLATNGTDEHLDAIVESLRPQGKLALIDDPKAFDIAKLKLKSLSLHWEFMFTRSMFGTADISEQGRLLGRVAEMVDAGRLRTTLAEIFGRIDAATLTRAHAFLESGRARGKIVLEARA
ncbi:MAG: zinc-binding alcohol dehydrogenase family protein [Pseudomonadota bacterium]